MTRITRTSAFPNGFYNKDRFLISLFLIMGLGIFIGSVTAGNNAENKSSILFQIHSTFIQNKLDQSFLQLFWSAFLSEFLYIIVIYISGVCAIGIPILYIIPLIYGIGKGIVLGFLYATNGFYGVLNAILFHSIQTTCLILLTISALKKSYTMSRQTFFKLNSNVEENNVLSFKKYNQFYIVILLLCIVFCLIDALMFKLNIFN